MRRQLITRVHGIRRARTGISKAVYVHGRRRGCRFKRIGQRTVFLRVDTAAVLAFGGASDGRIVVEILRLPSRGGGGGLATLQLVSLQTAGMLRHHVREGLIETAAPEITVDIVSRFRIDAPVASPVFGSAERIEGRQALAADGATHVASDRVTTVGRSLVVEFRGGWHPRFGGGTTEGLNETALRRYRQRLFDIVVQVIETLSGARARIGRTRFRVAAVLVEIILLWHRPVVSVLRFLAQTR